jgi:hypothetical protein
LSFEETGNLVNEERETEKKPYDVYGRGKASVPFKVVVKPRSVMGDYIALHGLCPQNELPENMRGKIPEDEIWMRQDVFDNPERRERILQGHEKYELSLMESEGLTYKQAHRKAQFHEKFYLLEREIDEVKHNLKIRHYDAVRILEPTQKEEKEEVADAEPKR